MRTILQLAQNKFALHSLLKSIFENRIGMQNRTEKSDAETAPWMTIPKYLFCEPLLSLKLPHPKN